MSRLIRRLVGLVRGPRENSLRAEAMVRRGVLARSLGRPRQATRMLSSAARDRRVRRDPQLYGYALWNLAFALRTALRLGRALKLFRRSAEIFKNMGDNGGLAYGYCGEAGVLRLLGRPRLSLKRYIRAGILFQRERDAYGIAYSSCGAGNALRRMGRWREALPYYDAASRRYRTMGDRINEGYVLWGRWLCLRALGMTAAARDDFDRASRIFNLTKDPRGNALIRVWSNREMARSSTTLIREAQLS